MTELHEAVAAERPEDDDGFLEREADQGNELAVRDLLARAQAAYAERDRLKALKAEIAQRYDERIASLEAQASAYRQSIEAYLVRWNEGRAVSFPDVGTAYLTTRHAKITLTNAEAFEAWLETAGLPVPMVETFDKKTALALVQGEGGRYFLDTEQNALIDRRTGEVVDVAGVEVEPESKTLALRKAA